MTDFNNEVLEEIWKDRYCKNNETLSENYMRVATYCGDVNESEKFFDIMNRRLFYPAGRTMSNCGIGKNLTLNNCFVAPQIRDSLEDIFDKVKLGAITHQKGGGIGYDFSQIRPKDTPTSNDAIASGAVSFMDCFNSQTATILQGGRRGANMGVMNVYSMDIEEFINAKSYERGKLEHFNLSVMVDNDFMEAVKNDKNIFLHYPVYSENGNILKDAEQWTQKKEISAKYIWDLIMNKAYNNGEPGIFFYENLNSDNNLWYVENIVCSNPCGEYLAGTVYGNNPMTKEMLDSNDYGGSCNLGSVFLHNLVNEPFTKKAKFDYYTFKEAINTGVRFLDNIIDINKFPDKIYENYQKALRTIGIGVTGLADALAMLNMKYNSDEARSFTYELMNFFAYNVYMTSIELAKEKGSFPFLDKDKFIQSGYIQKHLCIHPEWQNVVDGILEHGIRNGKMISIAPTGTLSLTYGNNCSSGIEPIFSLTYDRKIKMGGQSEENIKIVKMKDYAYDLWEKTETDNIVTEDIFVTALEMSVDDHINMLRSIAFHADMSVSKTINVPSEYTFEDTKNIYMRAWKAGIKGCTIFRPNEIRQGILIANGQKDDETFTKATISNLSRGDVLQVNDDVIGKKRKLTTGCGSLHCTAFFDPVSGDLLETYLSKGSTGGCTNFMIGLSRMISLAARSGCTIHTIIDQLNSSGACPSYAVRSATKKDTSKGSCCPIAIGNALLNMYNELQDELGLDDQFEEDMNESSVSKSSNKTERILCPECGEELFFEGGCNICKSCGWSKCS